MARIYLSPSTQDANQYAGGGTGITDSEEFWCRKVAAEAERILRLSGHTVFVGGTQSVVVNVNDSNNRKVDAHYEIHTNAGGGEGTEAWAYTGSTMGNKIAVALYNRVAKVSNEPDRGVKHSTKYYALSHTNAPATIIEMLFHDDVTEAQEMRTDYLEFGAAVAQGIMDVWGGKIVAPIPPVATPPADPDVPMLFVGRRSKVAAMTAAAVELGVFGVGIDGLGSMPVVFPINPVPLRVKS